MKSEALEHRKTFDIAACGLGTPRLQFATAPQWYSTSRTVHCLPHNNRYPAYQTRNSKVGKPLIVERLSSELSLLALRHLHTSVQTRRFLMSGTSDKARFYLERSVPELQELASKKIFDKEEISSVAKKRSDFEHRINARGCQPSDYAHYAAYEMNLESLRRRRIKRLGIKANNHVGQRRIFFILERATKKFHGDVGLWMQYISFARKQRASGKVSQILTSVLRLHPIKAELWIYAASYAMEERGDMTEARSHMQRGLRFCKSDKRLWIEYARLEMTYISKIMGRRQILGLDDQHDEQETKDRGEGIGGDVVALPTITANDIRPNKRPSDTRDSDALRELSAGPALLGAIPIAIFDTAMKEFQGDQQLCLQFFDMIAEFPYLPCTTEIIMHMIDTLHALAPRTPETLIRWIKQPVIGKDVMSAGFPTNLGISLDRIQTALKKLGSISVAPEGSQPRIDLEQRVIEWMLSYLEVADLDPDISQVLMITLRKIWSQFQLDVELDPSERGAAVANFISRFQDRGIDKLAAPAGAWALRVWPDGPNLAPRSKGV